MIMNTNKGQSTGFAWIVSLVLLVVIGLLYIVFNQAMQTELIPVAQNLIENDTDFDNATKADALAEIDEYNSYWLFVPVFVFLAIMIYIIINALR